MTDRLKFRKFYPNYYTFLVSGAMVLLMGAILPYLIEEAHLSYTIAGTLLSAFAIGNFLASFVNPALSKAIGRKASIILTSVFVPFCLVSITMLPPVWMMIILFAVLGISRGCYSIINNAYINENSDGSPFALNILHMTFAIGAFASPMIMSLFFKFDFTWKAIVYTIAIAASVSVFFLTRLNLTPKAKDGQAKGNESAGSISGSISQPQKKTFYKMSIFWVSGLLLFFYLGLENCVNGWFVTYFKSTGIMSQAYANGLVSFTWLAVLFGRLFTALISTKIRKQKIILVDCAATSVFFVLLISTTNLSIISLSIVGLGFFFAGIYATTVANAHAAIASSDFGTSMLLAISALGGIITPQVVGSIADRIGLIGAIGILLVNMTGMIVLAIINLKAAKKYS